MSAIDYRTAYEDYWSRPDRWGSHSFTDPAALADQITATCGGGSVLDVGSGMGLLVRTLLALGVDARGVDVSPRCIAAANAGAPDRFVEGSVLTLPFADGSFETVISTDMLEHLAEEDLERALAELARVARRNVFIRLSTAPDRDLAWHLTVRPRAWWEERLFRAGLRKHRLTQKVLPFSSLEEEGAQITIVLEKLPADAVARYPLESLVPGRDLHADMLRESGRRSDAHIARYTLAWEFVRAGDVVLDAAGGLGYGAAILASGSGAARVIGIDADSAAVAYAKANYGPGAGTLEFHAGDAADLSFLGDRSVDVIVSFETLEHMPDPRRMLAEFQRVLTPGGRLIVSVPNQWTDESGKDPNPHHLHVYTWETLAEQLSERFLIERVYAQTAGGGMKLTDRPRRLDEVGFDADPSGSHALRAPADAEWFLAVAMKSPISAGKEGYRETAYPDHADLPGYHLTSFAKDYDNPWLVRSLVSIGMRCTNPELLEILARGVLAEARAGSPDEGAALCVLGYRLLERDDRTGVPDLVARIEEYQGRADDSPQGWRWCVSNLYIAARLLAATGQRGAAREMFLRCARSDCTRFSPLLASKTIDAYYRAGMLSASDGDADAARECWTAGLNETRRVLSGPWTNVWGSPERPLSFGMPEVAQLADLASRCAFAHDALQRRPDSPASVWRSANQQTFADLRRWVETLTRGRDWLERQVAVYAVSQRQSQAEISRLNTWIKTRDRNLEVTVDALKARIAQLDEGVRWLTTQSDNWQASAGRAETVVAELREWTQKLQEGNTWLEGQVEAWKKATEARDRRIADYEKETASLRARLERPQGAPAERDRLIDPKGSKPGSPEQEGARARSGRPAVGGGTG